MLSGKIILLQCRGLGDAIISTGVVNSIGASFPGTKVDILGRPEAQPIFRFNPHVGRYFEAHFPISNGLHFSFAEATQLLRQLREIRSQHYQLCINLVGDFRENLIGWLTGSALHHSLVWSDNHPIRKMIRVGLGHLSNSKQFIQHDTHSVYRAFDQVIEQLECKVRVSPRIYLDSELLRTVGGSDKTRPVVGIHPFARQQCRHWDGHKWKALALYLTSIGCEVWVFGAPSELATAKEWFGEVLDDAKVKSIFGDLDSFFAYLSVVDCFIGLDSASVHAANALNVPSIVLSGPNDIRVWAPPTALIVDAQHGCPYYPCFNRPKCLESASRYICMRSISVESVVDRIGPIIGGRRNKL